AIVRHHPGLAASPRVRYRLKVGGDLTTDRTRRRSRGGSVARSPDAVCRAVEPTDSPGPPRSASRSRGHRLPPRVPAAANAPTPGRHPELCARTPSAPGPPGPSGEALRGAEEL